MGEAFSLLIFAQKLSGLRSGKGLRELRNKVVYCSDGRMDVCYRRSNEEV